jgi:hypothetical protein
VSLPERWYCFSTCSFCTTCNAISNLSLDRSGGFYRSAALVTRFFDVFQPLG